MRFELIDDNSQLLDIFDDERAALDGVRELLDEDPTAAEEVALMAIDDQGDGQPVGRALNGRALVEAVRSASLAAMGLAPQSHA